MTLLTMISTIILVIYFCKTNILSKSDVTHNLQENRPHYNNHRKEPVNKPSKTNNHSSSIDKDVSNKLNRILEASVHLIDIHVTKLVTNRLSPTHYDGIEAEFCPLDWNLYKSHPWKLPMYRDIVANSERCRSGRIVVNLKSIVKRVRVFDQQHASPTQSKIKHLDPNFIFHESRCGSTLLANSLVFSSPKEVRLYSEAAPPLTALRICGENFELCSQETAVSIFRDVIYLMGRVTSEMESYLFFKMQSSATLSLHIVRKAFPMAPWIFLYRDPEEVMVSHLHIPNKSRAKCLQSRRNPPSRVTNYLESINRDLRDLSHEEYCAIYLSVICKSAAEAINTAENGKLLSYNHNLIDHFIDYVVPVHFGLELNEQKKELIYYTSQIYSKSRDKENVKWVEDSSIKHNIASDDIRQASSYHLASSYLELEDLLEHQG